MKELNNAIFVVRVPDFHDNGSVVTPKMLETLGISLEIQGDSVSLSGDLSKAYISLRGEVLAGSPIVTSPLVSIEGNVAITYSGSHYKIESINNNYRSLCNFEKNGGEILFDWILGETAGKIYISSQCFDGKKFTYIDKIINEENCFNHEDKHIITLDGKEYFIIWDALNFCMKFHCNCAPEITEKDFGKSFLSDAFPKELRKFAQLVERNPLNRNYYDPYIQSHPLNVAFKHLN